MIVSVTFAAIENEPAAVGVPLNTPEALMVIPPGKPLADHEKLPGRKDFDSVQAQRAISAEHRQAAQLFFLTVLESELKKAAKTDPSGEYSTVGRGME